MEEVKKVYKVPEGVTEEQLSALQGEMGNYLAPILDGKGNLIISVEEFERDEFQMFKFKYPELTEKFELIDWIPNPDLIVN